MSTLESKAGRPKAQPKARIAAGMRKNATKSAAKKTETENAVGSTLKGTSYGLIMGIGGPKVEGAPSPEIVKLAEQQAAKKNPRDNQQPKQQQQKPMKNAAQVRKKGLIGQPRKHTHQKISS